MTTPTRMTEICRPIVNLNGASPESLIQARIDAREALRKAMSAVHVTVPHGRDYIGHDAQFKADTELHNDRCDSLYALYVALETEALAIQDQQK